MLNQQSLFGLGFANPNFKSNHDGDDIVTTHNNNNNSMDALMQSYMNQCLSYHEEQQQQQKEQHKTQLHEQLVNNDSTPPNPLQFIPASYCTEMTKNNKDNENDTDEEEKKMRIQKENEMKIQKAKEIARKLASKPIPTTIDIHSQSDLFHSSNNNNNNNEYYYDQAAQRRNEFITNVHSNKLQSYLLKNLNYILKKDEEVHAIQIQHLQQQREEQRLLMYHNNNKKLKKQLHHNKMTHIMGGIGTHERNRLQKSIDKTHHAYLNNNHDRNKQKCCGLYITGIKHVPKDKQDEQQDMICKLFESYGELERNQFYVDKVTGIRKGDALIVYNVEKIQQSQLKTMGDNVAQENSIDDKKINNFLNLICSQVRGPIKVLLLKIIILMFDSYFGILGL